MNDLHRLLRNPYYKGMVVHNGVEHACRHERLIDPVTWAMVQDILTPGPSPATCSLPHQRRLKTELAGLGREKGRLESDSAGIKKRVHDALDPLRDAHATYAEAAGTARKQLNRAIFAGIIFGPEPDQIRTELNEPFAASPGPVTTEAAP